MPGEETVVIAGAAMVITETVKKVVEIVEETIINSDYEYHLTDTEEVEDRIRSDMG